MPLVSFYLLEILENLWFSDKFRAYRKRPVALNELIKFSEISQVLHLISFSFKKQCIVDFSWFCKNHQLSIAAVCSFMFDPNLKSRLFSACFYFASFRIIEPDAELVLLLKCSCISVSNAIRHKWSILKRVNVYLIVQGLARVWYAFLCILILAFWKVIKLEKVVHIWVFYPIANAAIMKKLKSSDRWGM